MKNRPTDPCVETPDSSPFPNEVVELPILVSGRQIVEIERLACSRGMTVGQWIRGIIQGHLLAGQTGGASV